MSSALVGLVNAFVSLVPSLTAAGAETALAATRAEAECHGWALCIAVTDGHGELLAFQRMDGAMYPSTDAAIAKARTAARLRLPSKDLAQYAAAGNAPALALIGLAPLEGGVPIIIDGVVVGAVGTSGAAADEDVRASLAGVAAVQRHE